MYSGLTAQGVPAATAAPISHLPPIGVLFASFLGYNPIQQLLGPLLHQLSPAHAAYVTGRQFFPHLITAPFHSGLGVAFGFAIAANVIAAIASALTGRRRPPLPRTSHWVTNWPPWPAKAASSPANWSSPASRKRAPNRLTSPARAARAGCGVSVGIRGRYPSWSRRRVR